MSGEYFVMTDHEPRRETHIYPVQKLGNDLKSSSLKKIFQANSLSGFVDFGTRSPGWLYHGTFVDWVGDDLERRRRNDLRDVDVAVLIGRFVFDKDELATSFFAVPPRGWELPFFPVSKECGAQQLVTVQRRFDSSK